MSEEEEIKVITIDTKSLENCDVSNVIRLFFKEMPIWGAKKLNGKVMMTFPKYDKDERANCLILEIRNFIQKLHNEDPRFPFYYVEDTIIGMHLIHLACLCPLNNIVILEEDKKFRLKVSDPNIINEYLGKIEIFMRQLKYTEEDIDNKIKLVMRSIGLEKFII